MAKAKKLKSGSWRCLVYDYTDQNGKRHYESFTADTKKEAEYLAAEFSLNKKRHQKPANLSIKEAIHSYMDLKENILSPSTIRGYHQMFSYFSDIEDVKIDKLNHRIIQQWINTLAKTHSSKTVKNAYGLLSATMKTFNCPSCEVTLPQSKALSYTLPTDRDIEILLNYLKNNDRHMLIAVCLAAFGTLRRSEICALTAEDVTGNIIHVKNAMVIDRERCWQIKTTKTRSSDRFVELPAFVISLFPKTGSIVNLTPDIITKRLRTALKKLQLPLFRFHDLRHYSASIMHAMGIPDQYIMQRGGWKTDKVLKSVYRGTLDDYNKEFTYQINTYFEEMQHEMQHEKEKNPVNTESFKS